MKEQDPAELEQILLGQSYAKENAPSGAIREPREDPTQVVHLSVEHLHGPEEVAYGTGELVVVCLVRDGRPYVNSYVEHYFSLGAKHIFFLDNNSKDRKSVV